MSGSPIQPDGWIKPRGYSNGMRARGEVLAVAGQIGWNARGELVSDDFAAQFEQALSNVVDVVRAGGGKPEDLVSLTIFITDRGEYLSSLPAMGEGYRRLMGRHYPSMACIIIAGLLEPRAKVEIQGLAVLP